MESLLKVVFFIREGKLLFVSEVILLDPFLDLYEGEPYNINGKVTTHILYLNVQLSMLPKLHFCLNRGVDASARCVFIRLGVILIFNLHGTGRKGTVLYSQ